MHQLNQAVVEHLEKRLLDPTRLETLMDQFLNRRDEWAAERLLHVAEMERRATEADAKLTRLYEASRTAWWILATYRSRHGSRN